MVQDNTQKMLRILINGQSKINENVDKVRLDIKRTEEKLSDQIKEVETRLTKRIDTIGLQVARLEDDTPTLSEFDDLKQKFILHTHN